MLRTLLIGIILFTITIWTIIGNTFVIIAFITDKHIRQGGISNYYILNLAISDILLGIAVLPFSASYTTFKIWHFGKFFCEIWLIIDVLCSTASIWGLLMIAFDRYIATNYPMSYRRHRHSTSLAISTICIAWFVSIAICLVSSLFVERKHEIYIQNENKTISILTKQHKEISQQCILFKDSKFVVISSLLSFFTPLIIMIFLYTKVLYAIKQQSTIHGKTISNIKSNDDKLNHQIYSDNISKFERLENSINHDEISSCDQQQIGRREIKTEVRITRSVTIIIGCFICCYLPFFTFYIIRAVCSCLSVNAIEIFIWLGYSNSSINPVLYAVLNKNFRSAFQNMFFSLKRIFF